MAQSRAVMEDWYYVRDGQQQGPVRLENLRDMAARGELKTSDKVWSTSMRDWTAAGEVDGIFSGAPADAHAPTPPPLTGSPAAHPNAREIEPGSESIEIGKIFSHTFKLLQRNFSVLVVAGLIFFGVNTVLNAVLREVIRRSGLLPNLEKLDPEKLRQIQTPEELQAFLEPIIEQLIEAAPTFFVIVFTFQIVSGIIHLFLGLGLNRISLNVADGKPSDISQLFGEGALFLRALGAKFLCVLFISIGLMGFVLPGIYLMIKLSAVIPAIVDRKLGVFEAIQYSFRITRGNGFMILILALLAAILACAFFVVTCGIGAILIQPIFALGWIVTYRWMQYGRRIVQDPA